MGLFSRIFGSGTDGDSLEDSAKAHLENPEESNILLDPEILEGRVNTDHRAEIIDTHYSDVSTEDAQYIAEILKEYTETYDLEEHDAKEKIREQTGLESERVYEIFWTESSSIQKCHDISEKQNLGSGYSFVWRTAKDPCSPICEEVSEITTAEGGAVPLDELHDLLQTKAEKYRDQGGTPERMSHWVPHHKCSAVLQMRID